MNSLVEIIPAVTMETLHNLYHDSEAMYQRTSLVIWGLSGFIMLFAVINLINTLIATTLSRKHEFSTLRSIDIGEKTATMDKYNGREFYWLFWNISTTLIAGTAVGYGIVRYLNSVGINAWVWQFPFIYMGIYIIISIFLPLIISAIIIRILQQKSIVEQLRETA